MIYQTDPPYNFLYMALSGKQLGHPCTRIWKLHRWSPYRKLDRPPQSWLKTNLYIDTSVTFAGVFVLCCYVPVQGLHPLRAAYVRRWRHNRRNKAAPVGRLLQIRQTNAAFISQIWRPRQMDPSWTSISQNAVWPSPPRTQPLCRVLQRLKPLNWDIA